MNTYLKFLIPFLAGSSTLLGIVPTYFNNSSQNKIIGNSLGLAAGIMISLSIFSLIPESFSYLSGHISLLSFLLFLLFFNVGVIINTFINKWSQYQSNNDYLYGLGLSSLIALIIHNIPEGIITFITTSNDIRLGFSMSLAIALHNIPEGISIAIPIYYSTNNRKKALLLTAISGFSELFGAIISYLFIGSEISSFFMFSILSITAGIMIHLSLTELIPSSIKYQNSNSIFFFILGFIIMILVIFIF